MNDKSPMRSVILVAVALLIFAVLVLSTGCFTRTVYIPHGQPVRLRQDVPSVKVWALDKNGKPYKTTRDLKNGFWVGPMKINKDD